MALSRPHIWEKIRQHPLDDPASALAFTDRLARDNGWDLTFALGAVEEYRRFMYLICVAPHPLTPSDQVDQVWHLHLLYTSDYWDEWCAHVLGRKVQHGPTQGGRQEGEKYQDLYARTLHLYAQEFGHAPPAKYWPIGSLRFSDIDFVRANRRTHWIIPKPRWPWKRH